MNDNDPIRAASGRASSIGALLLGFGVGLGLSFLFTPRSGEENRKLIAEKTKEGVDYTALAIGELKDQVQSQLESAEEAAQEFKGRIGGAVTSLKDRVQEAVRAGQEAYREELQQRDSGQEGPSSRAATSGS